MSNRSGSEGGAFQPKQDYNRTGATDTGGIYRNATFTGATAIGAGATLTAPVITGAVLTPTVAVALTAAQSGVNVFLNAAAGFAITLPAVAAGLSFRFTVAAVFATTNFTIITPALANLIFGGATVAGADVPADAEDTISFVATAEALGDFVDLWSDGTSWFVNGRGTTSGSITFTAT
jgi:hypothetical protein